jgi:tetratricopeptide (TPR) repeat protein
VEAFDPVDLAASLEKACDEVAAARACADRAAPVERALVEALGSRYQVNDPSADLVAWNADYAEAMRDVYRAHPDELDVAALFADALMNLTPWALWDRYTGLPCEGELLRIEQPPMAEYLEAFVPMRLHVFIRFGMWEDILALPLPRDPGLYCTTTAMRHYAHGVAYAETGRMEEADAARDALLAAVPRVPDSRYLFNNTCQDILAVAGAMLDGELEYRRGQFDAAFEHLHRAIALDDALPYDEPWGWMQPTRHAYGALLLEQGRVEEAETVYAEDLGYDPSIPRSSWHPGNVWSLHGYHECLARLGKLEAARIVKQQLDVALARADVPIKSSCFCRKTHHAAVA